MISRVRGELIRRDPGSVEVLTLGGVAYEIEVPLSVYERLPREGSQVELRTFQVVREDAVALFGFLEDHERRLFSRLITASGVGPRLALAMMSSMTPERLVRALAEKDVAALRNVPGIGRKTAERLVLELADRLDDIAVAAPGVSHGVAAEEAVSALVALGYSSAAAAAAVRDVLDEQDDLAGAALIKAALARMSR